MKSNVFILCVAVVALVSCNYAPRNHGKSLYEQHCASCHMEAGQGLGELMPPLANADWITEDPLKVACVIKHGIEGPIVVNGISYEGQMAGYARLSDIEIANLVNYIATDLNGSKVFYEINEVRQRLSDCDNTP